MSLNQRKNASLISQQVRMDNFTPQYSAKITTSGTSTSVTFPIVTGTLSQTFKITNKGSNGAYVAWGETTATAVASTSTPTAGCDYIASGAIFTQNFELDTGTVDTIAAIQDTGATTLEISIGFGQ